MNRKIYIFFVIAALFAAPHARAQNFPERGYRGAYLVSNGADTSLLILLHTVYVFENQAGEAKYLRQIDNVKKVYPLAKEARARIGEMERQLAGMPDPVEQRAYVKKMESALIKEYAPVVTPLTYQQGGILIKLIARELERTSFAIVRDMLGGVSAGIWQGFAMIFGANLKQGYDKAGEDEMIEDIIILFEHGMI